MGAARIAIYLVGLALVVAAAWVFLTQTDLGQSVPAGVALALILLIVGIGVMASAKGINDSRATRRIVHESAPGAHVHGARYGTAPVGPYDRTVEGETVVEERRFD